MVNKPHFYIIYIQSTKRPSYIMNEAWWKHISNKETTNDNQENVKHRNEKEKATLILAEFPSTAMILFHTSMRVFQLVFIDWLAKNSRPYDPSYTQTWQQLWQVFPWLAVA